MSDQLADLLLSARLALVDGDYPALAQLVEETEACLAQAEAFTTTDIARLQRLASENLVLATAACRGLSDARQRFQRDAGQIYDAQGRRSGLSSPLAEGIRRA